MKLLHNLRPMGRAARLALSASLLIPLVFFGAVFAVITATPAAATAALPYNPLTPARICDTRAVQTGVVVANQCDHNGTGTGTLAAAGTLTVAMPSSVPAGATAVVLNVTVTNTTAASYLTAWPTGTTQPLVSNLNWTAGVTIANLVEVTLGTSNSVSLFNYAGSTDVAVDLEGYVGSASAGTGLYNPLTPARICDTRAVVTGVVAANQCNNNGTGTGTLAAGGTLTVQVTGNGSVPSTGVAAVVLNVTVTNTTAASYLTAWPTGATQPLVSNLNWVAGQTIPNRVIIPVSSTGQVSIYNYAGAADVVIDVGGWFTNSSNVSATGDSYVALPPTRICDTRAVQTGVVAANQCNNNGTGTGTLGAADTLPVQVTGQGGVPSSGVSAVVANVTVTNTTGSSYLTVWPAGTTQPLASDLNWVAGETIPNLVVVELGSDGALSIFNYAGSTDVVVDVEGYYI
jgi:hypothetical protein